MKNLTLFILILILIANSCFAQQETIRVATYSLLRFDSDDEARVEAFQLIIDGVTPDILICQDIISEEGADFFLDEVLDPDVYDRADYIDCEGQNDNMCYFRSDMFTCGNPVAIETDLRDITLYPLSLISEPFLPVLYLASTYLKGSTGGANEQRRLGEVTELLNYMDAEGLNAEHVLFGGNFNMYDSDEPAWEALHENDLFKDPLETPGDWHDAEEFAAVHTQSTRTDQFGGGAPGGLDDRFDFIFMTSVFDNEEGWMYEADSYITFGNDGNHLNQAITDGENQAVNEEVAQALHDATDHLPVYMEISYTPGEISDFTIQLRDGWNMISSPLQPIPADMVTVWEEIVGRNNLILLKSDRGRFYVPRVRFNNMRNWAVTHAYIAKVNEADELVLTGQFAPQDTPINLRHGWKLVPYFPEQQVEAPDAVIGIVDELIIIKDFLGRFYKPEFNFSNMGLLRRSQGYYAKMNAAAVLVWNVPEEEILEYFESAYSLPQHFIAPPPTGRNMSIMVSTDNPNLMMSKGNELGAFRTDGKCVGSTVLDGKIRAGIAIWGDDLTTPVVEGALEGESIVFRIWDSSTGCATELKLNNQSISYETDGFELLTLADQIIPTEFSLMAPYPNPFNSTTGLSFTLPEQHHTILSLLDISGREMLRLVDTQLGAGTYYHTFNASDFPSGLYFVTLTAGQYSKTAKLTLMK